MKIEDGNANKKSRINKQFSISIVLALVIFMISGSTTMSHAAPQTLPSCTDPTGQNLPCMMVISTLPPPANAVQCQETSGQILSCSYGTQSLTNGNQIAVITVYVPANFVFSSPTAVKVVVHETTSSTTTKIIREIRGAGGLCRGGEEVAGKCLFMPPGPHTAIWKKAWIDAVDLNGYKNPYKRGTAEYVRYLLGYIQALQAEKQAGIKNPSPPPSYVKPLSPSISPPLVAGLPTSTLPPLATTTPTPTTTPLATTPTTSTQQQQSIPPGQYSTWPPKFIPTPAPNFRQAICPSGTNWVASLNKCVIPTQTCPDGSVIAATDQCPQVQQTPQTSSTPSTCPDGSQPASDGSCPSPNTNNNPPSSNNNPPSNNFNPPPTNNNPSPPPSNNNPTPPPGNNGASPSSGNNNPPSSGGGSEGSGSSNGGGSSSNGGGSSPP